MVFWHQSGTNRQFVIHTSTRLDIFVSTGGAMVKGENMELPEAGTMAQHRASAF
jgi:hypothetical protein